MRSLSTKCGAAFVFGVAGVAGAQIAEPAVPKFKYSVDGGVTMVVPLTAAVQNNGMMKYVATVSTPESLEISIVYVVDDLNNPTASAAGQFKCTNNSGVTRGVDASVDFPLCPAVSGGTLYGGTVTMLVVTNADGGGVTCLPGSNCVWQATVGGSAIHGLFWCPFQIVTTGAGTMQSNSVFGAPVPGLPGPNSAPSIGSRNRFSLSSGDAVTITSNLIVKTLGSGSGCAADLNGDGTIDGLDLAELLGHWGGANSCGIGDVNEDGVVDGLDMALVLGAWGDCGS